MRLFSSLLVLGLAIAGSGCSDDNSGSIPPAPTVGEGEGEGEAAGVGGGAGDGGVDGGGGQQGGGDAGDAPGGEGEVGGEAGAGEGEGEAGGGDDGLPDGEGEGEVGGDAGGGTGEGEGEGEVPVEPGPECQEDGDCEVGWCRANDPEGPDADSRSCVAFLGDGERCGGFVPEWHANRCDDGLVCADSPPFLPDAPGWCRQACDADDACPDGQYCGAAGSCRPHGDCIEQSDCQDPANQWDRLLCEGISYCGKDGCSAGCDQDPTCFDFGDDRVWFGACRAVLGWGRFGAECLQISGCDAGQFELSATQQECETRCLGQVPEGDCDDDAQCAPAGFCRPVGDEQDAASACHPYQDEGERCGGFVRPSFQERCEPDMTCTDIPEGLADAPGTCRQPCDFDNPDPVDECGRQRYCSRNDACRGFGDCFDHLDCELNTNGWPHIECVGYGVCGAGDDGQRTCGWRCGDARCRDLSDVIASFGACERLLGFGVVNGQCEAVSGCGDSDYPLFETRRECQDLCEENR